MKTKPYLQALLTGLGIAFLCTLFVPVAYPMMLILYILPGLVFGGLLLTLNDNENRLWKNITFLVISTFTYTACICGISLLDTDFRLLDPVRILLASCIGAVVLSAFYQLLILGKSAPSLTLLNLLLTGIGGGLPSTLILYVFNQMHYATHNNSYFSKLSMCSIFIIFPLWQTLFVLVMGLRASPFSAKHNAAV